MKLFIAYHVVTNVLAVIIARDRTDATWQLIADQEEPPDWQIEDYGTVEEASISPTYFDLEQILSKGW